MLNLIDVKCSIGARDDLGRTITTALENKQNFIGYLKILQKGITSFPDNNPSNVLKYVNALRSSQLATGS